MKLITIICGLFFCISAISFGQNFNKTDFFEADMELLSNEYVKAQKIYAKLVRSEPDNANLNFLNGLCLINIPGRKKESLEFLAKAAPYATSNYKYGSPKELNAPLEVLKYYAIASKLNDDIPKAIELLNQYIPLLGKDQKEIDIANRLLQSCTTAQRLQTHPVFYSKTDLGSSISSEKSKQYPVVNQDETMLLYSVKGNYNKDDIYFSEKVNGMWSDPVKITTYLGVKDECFPSSISSDNERIYLTVKTGLSSSIYYTYRKNNRWQKMIRLDKPVNEKGWDSDAYESSDGKYLYFASDRKGGFGAIDIYRVEMDEKGNWVKPVNLGETINSPQNDRMPVINMDDSKLYFKSEGHDNMGGYDIFYSMKIGDNEWSTPVNMGYPISTTDDDIYYMPAGNGNFAYVAMSDPAFDGNYNLYYLEILNNDPFKKYEITGQIALENGSTDFSNINIEIISTETYEKIFNISPDELSGRFNFELGSGSYMLNFIKPEYNTYTQLVDLSSDYSENTYLVYPFLEKTIPDVDESTVVATAGVEEIPIEEPPIVIEEEVAVIEEPVPEPEEEYIAEQKETNEYTSESRTDYYGTGNYTIQVMASTHRVIPDNINNSLDIEIQKGEDDYYRYVTGIYSSIAEAESAKKEIVNTRYRDAFIRYYNLNDYLNREIRPIAYTIQIMALNKEIDLSTFGNLNVKVSHGDDQIYRYTISEYASLSSARNELQSIVNKGYKSAFIIATSKISNYK